MVLQLGKCIYGLVQAVRQYHKKMVYILNKIGFTYRDIDPYLYIQCYKKGPVHIALYVDDNLLVGGSADIKDTVVKSKKNSLKFKVKNLAIFFLENQIWC